MSTLENLANIEKYGIRVFARNEKLRWSCSECGGTICVHSGNCYSCGRKKQAAEKGRIW
jgi:rubrerythrin